MLPAQKKFSVFVVFSFKHHIEFVIYVSAVQSKQYNLVNIVTGYGRDSSTLLRFHCALFSKQQALFVTLTAL